VAARDRRERRAGSRTGPPTRRRGFVDVHAFSPGELSAPPAGGLCEVSVAGGAAGELVRLDQRTLEATADPGRSRGPGDVRLPRYLMLQQLDRRLLESRLPPRSSTTDDHRHKGDTG